MLVLLSDSILLFIVGLCVWLTTDLKACIYIIDILKACIYIYNAKAVCVPTAYASFAWTLHSHRMLELSCLSGFAPGSERFCISGTRRSAIAEWRLKFPAQRAGSLCALICGCDWQ